MRYSTSAILILLFSVRGLCQSVDYRMGARAMSLGYAGATLTDEWSAFHNIGSLAGSDPEPSFAFSYRNLYAVQGLGKMAATAIWPIGKACGTINFFRFGDAVFNETRAGLGFSHKIGLVSLGMQVNYQQVIIETFGSRGIFYIDAGGTAEIFKGFGIGAYIQNISRTVSSGITGERFPILMGVGIAYRPEGFVMIALEIERDQQGVNEIGMGMEFSIRELLFLRSGITLNPARNFFGFGIKPRRFKIDYAMATQPHLGLSHEVSICYLVRKRK